MYQSIALVDVSCLFKRTFEANPNKGGENTLAELERISQRVEHMVLCLDAPPYSRRELFPEYKANRTPPETTEVYQKRWLYEKCIERGYSIAKLKGAEGDDVVATLARIYGESCPNVWIVGADKDLAQCVTETVRQLVPALGERPEHFRDPAAVKEKFEVWPHQIPLFLALWGDKGDNIPGVPGIGPVKAAGLIAEFKTFVGIAENLGSISGKVGDALRANWDQLALSLKLTTLDTHLPLDAADLLVKRAAKVVAPTTPAVELEFDGFTGNETPMPEAPSVAAEIVAEHVKHNDMLIGKDPRADEFLRQEAAARAASRERHEEEQKLEADWREKRRQEQAAEALPPKSAPAPKVTEAEFDPIGKSPGASGPMPPRPVAAVVSLPGPVKANLRGLALLRAPFGKHQISKLPKGSKEQNNCPYDEKRSCSVCGGFHHPKMVHLDYVGHAALTDRLLESDPLWSWEPMCSAPNGLPLFDQTGGLWIRLTVCGVTRLGYGHAPSKQFQEPGAREKEVIGDALRNAAMRFGAALDLWHKGDDLHDEDWDATAAWDALAGGA